MFTNLINTSGFDEKENDEHNHNLMGDILSMPSNIRNKSISGTSDYIDTTMLDGSIPFGLTYNFGQDTTQPSSTAQPTDVSSTVSVPVITSSTTSTDNSSILDVFNGITNDPVKWMQDHPIIALSLILIIIIIVYYMFFKHGR